MTELLMINLGKGTPGQYGPLGYQETPYVFPDGTSYTTRLAGLALWSWLRGTEHPPASVRFAATREVWEEKRPLLPDEVRARGLDWEKVGEPLFVDLPRAADDLWSFLPDLEAWVSPHRDGEEPPVLHVDLTHAYRAIPIAQPWLALYLERLGLAEVGVLGYGAFVPGEDTTPYIDTGHVMILAEWAAGVRDFETYGRAGTLSHLIREKEKAWRDLVYRRRTHEERAAALDRLQTLVRAAEAMERSLPAGLPIELGLDVRRVLGDSESGEVASGVEELLPGTGPLAEKLHRAADRFAWAERIPARGSKGDRAVLTHREVDRQLDLVSYWGKLGAIGDALRGLRELMVNRVLLAHGVTRGWLERKNREAAEKDLNDLRPQKNDPTFGNLPDDLRQLIGLWDEVCNARNAFAHAGMQPDVVDVEAAQERLGGFVERYRALPDDDSLWSVRGPDSTEVNDEHGA